MSEARILLVDDDDDLRPALVQGLEIEGFAVEAFARAEDALSRVTRDFYGVVVSDIRMPGIDGMAFLRQLLRDRPGAAGRADHRPRRGGAGRRGDARRRL